jgi:hypothetical protein
MSESRSRTDGGNPEVVLLSANLTKVPQRGPGLRLSKDLTLQARKWAETGEFVTLFERLGAERKRLEVEALAYWARAAWALGRVQEAQSALLELAQRPGTPESRVLEKLARAHGARVGNDWARAAELAGEARILAEALAAPTLKSEAIFAEALALSEQGSPLAALELFSQVARDEAATAFRRGMAELNVAYLLWDLGRVHELAPRLPRVPAAFRPRLELFHELYTDRREAWLAKLAPTGAVAQLALSRERFQSALLLTKGAAVLLSAADRAERVAQGTVQWLIDELRSAVGDSSRGPERVWALQALRWWDVEVGPEAASAVSVGWRAELETRFWEVLTLVRMGDFTQAQRVYREGVLKACGERFFASPLVPPLREDGSFDDPSLWVRALAARLAVRQKSSLGSLVVRGQTVEWREGARVVTSFSLQHNPKSLRLLEILAGEPGRRVAKRAVHEQLTRTVYSPGLHDSRLFKLIRRLEERLRAGGCPELWTMPRDNTVLLKERIYVER